MKKILALFVIITVFFNCSSYVATAEKTDVQKGIAFLLEQGYSYEEIVSQFPEDDLEVISHATSYDQVQIEYEIEENTENHEDMDSNINSSSKLRAGSIVPGNNTADTPGGKLTQVVSVFGLSENKVLITYNFKWNEVPSNLKTDCCALLFDGAKLSEVRNAYYEYTSRNLTSGSQETVTCKKESSTSSNGIGISFKFVPDSTHAGGIRDHQNFNHKGYISCLATITSSKCINVWSRYYHQQGKLTLTPRITINGVAVTLSSSTQMVLMNPNPYLSCKIK